MTRIKTMLTWLHEDDCQETSLVGGKAANLGRLMVNHSVPPGFCLTTNAYAQWLLKRDSEKIPQALQTIICESYAKLSEHCQTAKPRVAVRSSAIGEDGQTASFAGLYETYLNVVGIEAVSTAVARCWSSSRSERVQAYCQQQDQPTESLQLAVLVQSLVVADISLVAFSSNPVTHDQNEVIINANWGLGESLVSGTATPDMYVVRKTDFVIIERKITEKQFMTVLSSNNTKEVPLPRSMRSQQTLSEEQVIEVAELLQTLETQMGWPVDVECAYQAGKLYLLQCRPITTILSESH